MPLTDRLKEGDVFAEYTILRLLGAGGMGEVYLAQHPRLPRRDALKILPANLTADNEFRGRFIREADLAAGLSHPNIVGVYDRGEFEGQLWISMDYVEGTDTAELLKSRYQSGMPQAEVLEIITAVAGALDYAHLRGLLHRDVKPANILLGEGLPGKRRIFLADFGIARQLGDISGLTATNMMVGTTAYSAPEQLQGLELDGRVDEYALGCTAFHLLTGSAPFQGTNPAVVITQHLSAPRPLVAERRPELAGLNQVLTKAIAKDPSDRYESCSDFAAALAGDPNTVAATTWTAESGDTSATAAAGTVALSRAAGEGEPPTSVLSPPRRRRIRSPVLIAVIAAVVLVAVVAIVGEQLLHKHSSQPGNAAPSSTVSPTGSSAAPSSTPPIPTIQLSRYITDQPGVLIPVGRAALQRAIDNLAVQRNVHLWVVYVNNFSRFKSFKWAEANMQANGFTDSDALLAISTDDRLFSFRVPTAVTNGTSINLDVIRRERIEPAVNRGEWSRAGVAAANGLETAPG